MDSEEIIEFVGEHKSIFSGVRAGAVRILSRFERSDSYIDKLLDYEIKTAELTDFDKGLLKELVYGVIRWKGKLDWVLVGFYHGDYLKCLNLVKNALRVALYQILFLERIPVLAAINDSVEIINRIQGEKTAGIASAVLRNISRNIDAIRYPEKEEDIIYYFSVIYSHPRWMVKRWLDRFGETQAEKLLFINNRRPYVTVRVNTLKTNTESIIASLKQRNISYFISPLLKQSILLKDPRLDIYKLDLFTDGLVTPQDTSASLAVKLASPKEGQTVIDLCSAPGAKSFFLAELMKNNGKIYAIEKYKSKLDFILEGSQRLGLDIIEPINADATEFSIDEKVDLVFADVPCSLLGMVAKKPELKWKREREDLNKFVEAQHSVLDNAARLVKPGGAIVYSTNSTEPEENQEVIEWFLNKYTDFILDPAEFYLPHEVCSNGFMEILPHIHYIDGAFAARLVKKKNG